MREREKSTPHSNPSLSSHPLFLCGGGGAREAERELEREWERVWGREREIERESKRVKESERELENKKAEEGGRGIGGKKKWERRDCGREEGSEEEREEG